MDISPPLSFSQVAVFWAINCLLRGINISWGLSILTCPPAAINKLIVSGTLLAVLGFSNLKQSTPPSFVPVRFERPRSKTGVPHSQCPPQVVPPVMQIPRHPSPDYASWIAPPLACSATRSVFPQLAAFHSPWTVVQILPGTAPYHPFVRCIRAIFSHTGVRQGLTIVHKNVTIGSSSSRSSSRSIGFLKKSHPSTHSACSTFFSSRSFFFCVRPLRHPTSESSLSSTTSFSLIEPLLCLLSLFFYICFDPRTRAGWVVPREFVLPPTAGCSY